MLPPKKLAGRSAGTTPLSQLIHKSPSASPFSPNHSITNNNDNYNNNSTNSNILPSPMTSPYLQQQHSTPSRTFTLKKSLPSSPARNSLSLSGQSSPLTQKVPSVGLWSLYLYSLLSC